MSEQLVLNLCMTGMNCDDIRKNNLSYLEYRLEVSIL